MATRLFRQEAIDARRDRLTGTVIAATPPRARVYAWLLFALAAALAALLIFGTWSTRIAVRGIVSPAGAVVRLHAPAAAEVLEVRAREGAPVRRGEPLLILSLTQGHGESGGDGISGRLAQLERQDSELARQIGLAGSLGAADTATLDQQKAGLAASVASLERQRGLASEQIRLAESNSRRAARLAEEGAGTQRQVEESRAQLLALRLDRERLGERIGEQREALRAIDSQILSRRIGAEQSRSEIEARRAALAEQRDALTRQGRLTLTSPVQGVVADIGVRAGGHAGPERSLLAIVPAGAEDEVQLYASSRAAGLLRAGQKVRLYFDALPYQKYGAGEGRVTWVSEAPADPSELQGAAEPLFRIRVAITRLPAVGPRGRSIRPGMTLSANVVAERRRLWELFLDPVLKAIRR
ncbi:MAG TPA: HlyD family efflux transporter periplasmic adaptor subunit [Allosphingosinicella sp.]